MLYWGQKTHRIQSIMHFACLKVVLTRMNLTHVCCIPQMETFCSTRSNLTAMVRYFTCSASFEWYPRQMQPWPVPSKMIVYTQEQFLECNRKWHVTTERSWVFLQASCWRNKCFSFSSRHRRKSFWSHTEENTYLRQIWLFHILDSSQDDLQITRTTGGGNPDKTSEWSRAVQMLWSSLQEYYTEIQY